MDPSIPLMLCLKWYQLLYYSWEGCISDFSRSVSQRMAIKVGQSVSSVQFEISRLLNRLTQHFVQMFMVPTL